LAIAVVNPALAAFGATDSDKVPESIACGATLNADAFKFANTDCVTKPILKTPIALAKRILKPSFWLPLWIEMAETLFIFFLFFSFGMVK
jgi:hypothetical protein